MSRIVGIDLGTTNSLVATVDSRIPLVIADEEGRRLTPSVVHFPGPDTLPMVGDKANRVRVLKPDQTIYSVKRYMGRRGSELTSEENLVPYRIRGEAAAPVTVDIQGRQILPEEVSAEILKKLKRDAEAYFHEPISRAVITVPAYFNDAQRNATKRAGELAGFTVERIINEPTAAALAYGLNRIGERSKIAVYDLGGGTFDLSILELHEGVFQVLSTNGNTQLGGDDMDKRIVDFLLQQIAASHGPSLAHDPSAVARVREAAEEAKIRLSSATEVEVALPFLTPVFSFSYTLRRTKLEDLTRDIIARTRVHCLRSLADAKLEPKDLDQVILVGGQTRMPLVREMVSEIFHCSEFEATSGTIRIGDDPHRRSGPQLNTSQNPEEAVALGAALQAAILSGELTNLLLLDVTPLSLGLETFGGLMNVIIPRNTTIPAKAGEVFTTAVDAQREMLIHVLQGERERARDNWSLGKFVLEFESVPKGAPRVGVQFEIDANGILRVLARDIRTGREKIVEMKSAVDVNDTDVQKMIEESVEHAFDDLSARRWIETKLQAQQTLEATQLALNDPALAIDPIYQSEIKDAVKSVEASLASEKSDPSAEDLKNLKSSLGHLDTVTQKLADLMIDQAIEAKLREQGILQANGPER